MCWRILERRSKKRKGTWDGMWFNGHPKGDVVNWRVVGLVRSSGGWRAVKEAFRDGIRLASVERILGSSGFVQKTLMEAEEASARKMQLRWAGVDSSGVIVAVCVHSGIDEKELVCASKHYKVSHARAVVSYRNDSGETGAH